MKRSIRLAVLVLGALTVLALAGNAAAAYTTPTLKVTQAGSKTTITVTQSQGDDATASARIYAPAGTAVTASQAPGTTLGPVTAQVTALALGGALLPLTGEIKVAPPGVVSAAQQAACTQGQAPTATWLMVLQAAGQTLNVPMYVVPTAGAETALGPAKVVVCLPPPDIPVEKGGATFGAKLINAEFSVDGVFSAVTAGAWVAFWTPYQAGNGQVNAAGTVATPAAIAPGAVTAKAKKSGLGAVVTGTVTQGGQARGGATVEVWGGLKKTGIKKLGKVKANAAGAFTFKARAGTYFRARAIGAAGSAPPLCQVLTPQLGGLPCLNPTVNGFVALSAIVAKK